MSGDLKNGDCSAVFEEDRKKYAVMLSKMPSTAFNVLYERISDNRSLSDWQVLAVQKEYKKRREETNS